MDTRSQNELKRISMRTSGDMYRKGIREERPYAEMGEMMQEAIRTAPDRKTKERLRRMLNSPRVQETINRKEMVVNSDYDKEVERRTEREIAHAIRTGRLKPPNMREYNRTKAKLWQKTKQGTANNYEIKAQRTKEGIKARVETVKNKPKR
jgi:hypothetical protein